MLYYKYINQALNLTYVRVLACWLFQVFASNKLIHIAYQVPQQKNDFDCGLFVLNFIKRFMEEAPKRLKKQDMAMVIGNMIKYSVYSYFHFMNVINWFFSTYSLGGSGFNLKRLLIWEWGFVICLNVNFESHISNIVSLQTQVMVIHDL